MTKKKTLVFSIFTFTYAAAILRIFSQSSFWKKTKKQEEEEEEEEKPNPGPDRISELPIEILHRILGFLDMDEFLIRTSLVSTKWRNLWKSVPILNFSHGGPDFRISRRSVDNGSGGGIRNNNNNNVEKYHNFVDHVLRLRDSEASKIQIFRYYCDDSNLIVGYDYLEDLHDFIVSAAVNQGAQEIQVEGYYNLQESSNNMIHFNPSIFTSGLLRKFTFAVINRHSLIQFPRSICCATQLTHLSLSGIRLPEGDDSNAAKLHLVCPVLETLVISNCYSEHLKVLDISAPRLVTLYIYNGIRMRFGGSDFLGGCRIEIRTPNLTSLFYSGRVYVDCFMENLSRIAYASLDFTKETGMVEETTSFAIKLLKGLTSAKSLTLRGGFEVFSEDILKELLTPFTSLRTLKLITSCKISSIHGTIHFFNSCSSLENLFWLGNEICTEESDENLMLPQCRLSHLKHVRIKCLHGHKNEIEFVKFLLKNSVVLEAIIIRTTADSPKQSIEEKLKQFIKEVVA